MKGKKVSMQDIADELGVSKFSVSVAISDGYGVSEELRLNIIMKAIEMGYDFGKNYRHKRRKNKTISLVIGLEKKDIQYWDSIIRSVEKQLMAADFDFRIIPIAAYGNYRELVARIYENHSVGVVLISDCDENIMHEINILKIPAVIVDASGYISLYHSFVCADNYAAGVIAAKELIGKGHKNIAFVGQKNYAYSFKQRCNGFIDTAEEAGVRYAIVQAEGQTDAYDSAAVSGILKTKERPTGFFCGNDSVALSLYNHARALNMEIPRDLSIIGFDRLTTPSVNEIGFATFEVDKAQIGRETVNLILEALQNRNISNKVVNVKTQFIDGKTLSFYNPPS